mgnify:CR=1 FL=1
MTSRPLDLILVSTPIGVLGSGKGGGVELTLSSLLTASRTTYNKNKKPL